MKLSPFLYTGYSIPSVQLSIRVSLIQTCWIISLRSFTRFGPKLFNSLAAFESKLAALLSFRYLWFQKFHHAWRLLVRMSFRLNVVQNTPSILVFISQQLAVCSSTHCFCRFERLSCIVQALIKFGGVLNTVVSLDFD
jgi:hypothetical protein